jgi:VCBS repeat protein
VRVPSLLFAVLFISATQSRPPDIPFRIQMIDAGVSETAAFADVNNDGRLDIVSGEFWYQAPAWTKHRIREINFNGQYIDDFTDLPIDVDADGFVDVVQFGYFSNNIVWMKNPGKTGGAWKPTEIDSGFPTEFALLVDLNNDGKARELLPEFDRPNAPLNWYELQSGKWIRHTISDKSYGHGIGAGDVNGDGRNDIITPRGWFEAPVNPATAAWAFHEADWYQHPIAASGRGVNAGSTGTPPAAAQFGFMYAIDINGDGRKDVLTSMGHDYGVCWFEQNADGTWTQRVIDNTWSQAHASALVDLNGDGQLDLITGKRFMAHNGSDPGEKEPLGVYWYEYVRPTATSVAGGQPAAVEWIKHVIDYGGRMGGGMQIPVIDIDGDGDLDIVCAGKSGLFFVENLTKGKR